MFVVYNFSFPVFFITELQLKFSVDYLSLIFCNDFSVVGAVSGGKIAWRPNCWWHKCVTRFNSIYCQFNASRWTLLRLASLSNFLKKISQKTGMVDSCVVCFDLFVSGATILNERYLVTAAHCVCTWVYTSFFVWFCCQTLNLIITNSYPFSNTQPFSVALTK